jgi:hypothetical protein
MKLRKTKEKREREKRKKERGTLFEKLKAIFFFDHVTYYFNNS